MAWLVTDSQTENDSLRSLALLAARLSLHNLDRDADPSRRSFKATFNQAQTLRRRLADCLHLSDRRARAAAVVCEHLARRVPRNCGDIRAGRRMHFVLARLWQSGRSWQAFDVERLCDDHHREPRFIWGG